MYRESKKRVIYKKHHGKQTGYLDWYFSDPGTELPIRDVTKRKGKDKSEPHYEKLTFNKESSCNANLLSGAIKRNDGYIFFFTQHEGQYIITGFYEIEKITKDRIEGPKGYRHAVKAGKAGFYSAKDSYPLSKIFAKPIHNPRWIKPKHLSKSKTIEILDHFCKKPNKIKEYVRLTKKYQKL